MQIIFISFFVTSVTDVTRYKVEFIPLEAEIVTDSQLNLSSHIFT